MARISPLMVAPPVIFAGLAAVFFIGMQRENPDELPSALAGKAAPPVVVTPLGELPGFTNEVLRGEGVKLDQSPSSLRLTTTITSFNFFGVAS